MFYSEADDIYVCFIFYFLKPDLYIEPAIVIGEFCALNKWLLDRYVTYISISYDLYLSPDLCKLHRINAYY